VEATPREDRIEAEAVNSAFESGDGVTR